MNREKIIQMVYDTKIVAIVRGLPEEHMVFLAEALYAGGIRMLEVTFNQKNPERFSDTADSIALLTEKMAGRMVIGAGTVTTPELVQMAYDAGGRFIVSPDCKQAVIEKTRELNMVSMPGALSPTEISAAYGWGADFVKVFPAGTLGAGYIKAVKAPLSHIPLLAVGGVNEKNVGEFIAAGAVGAGCGGNLVNRAWIEAKEGDKITELAKQFMEGASVEKAG